MNLKLTIMAFLFPFALGAHAQSIGAMLQQIAELKAYAQLAQKGYTILEEGIHTVRDIKDGEFSLHSIFYGSLQSVNPSVKQTANINKLSDQVQSTIRSFSAALAIWKTNTWLQTAELSYAGSLYVLVQTEDLNNITELQGLLTDNTYKMNDAERITAIETITQDISMVASTVRTFIDQVNNLIAVRQRNAADIGNLRTLIK